MNYPQNQCKIKMISTKTDLLYFCLVPVCVEVSPCNDISLPEDGTASPSCDKKNTHLMFVETGYLKINQFIGVISRRLMRRHVPEKI